MDYQEMEIVILKKCFGSIIKWSFVSLSKLALCNQDASHFVSTCQFVQYFGGFSVNSQFTSLCTLENGYLLGFLDLSYIYTLVKKLFYTGMTKCLST